MRKRITSLLLTLAMLLSLVPAMGVTASAAGTEIEAVSFTYTGYAEGENVADAVVTCNTAGVDFTYKWQYSDSGGSYSDATKLSAQFISGIKYTLWIYFKAKDGLALAELNETDVTLGGNNPGVVYTNYTIDEVNYSYGVPFSMSPLGGVTKYIVGFYTQGGKIGEESYRVELITGTDGKLTAEQVPTPTKEHYTFDGWYTAASGGTLLSLDTVYTDSSSKYYARWTENPALTGTATITGTAVSWNNTDNVEYLLYDGSTSDADIKAEWKKGGPYTTALAYTPVKGGITANSDGKRYDQTFSFNTIPEGNYKLVIVKPGHGLWIEELTVNTDNITDKSIRLYKMGDVNKDGKVNGTDALWVRQSSAGGRTLDAYQKVLADLNRDGKVNGTDALCIRQISAGSRTLTY